jgi:hypothetical protein
MAVPYTFGSATTSIPLSQLDSNFATAITLGNTAVQLGNTITTLTGVTNLASSGALTLGSNGNTTAITIDTSQNVLVGTASAYANFVIKKADGTQFLVSGTTYGARVRTDASYAYVEGVDFTGSASYQPLQVGGSIVSLATGGTERMRIDSGGNLLVGTTANNGVVTSFTTNAAGRAGFFMVNAASSIAADAVGISKFDNNTTTSQVFVKFFINNNGASSGLITAGGANQATFTSSSDSRLKENIVDLPSQLANIMALRPVEFDYIESEGGGHQIGFIAQEVKEIYPDVIGIREDGMFLVSDLNKNDARLIKAIQEMKAIIDTQASTITALTTRITALENK